MSRRPNILIFNPDQWRGDILGHLGHPAAHTPNLDRIVRESGVSFAQTVCPNACCTASRCSFMTGWYPHVRGHRTMSHMLQPDEPMLLRTLKDAGYHVWWGGKNDVVPAEHGFADYCHVKHAPSDSERSKIHARPEKEDWRGDPAGADYFSMHIGRLVGGDALKGETTNHDWAHVRGAIDFMRDYDREEPFCVYLPLGMPHPPYAAEDPWFSMIDRSKIPPPAPIAEDPSLEPCLYREVRSRLRMDTWSPDRWTELQATYIASCAQVDHQLGMIMEALTQADRYDDTAILVFSDHGDFCGDFGLVQKDVSVFPEGLVRVPLVIKPPRWIPVKPRVCQALVELIDVPATIEAMTGTEPRHVHFGRSLLPALAGETEEHRDAVFAEGGRRRGEESCKGLELLDEPCEDSLYWPTLGLHRQEHPANGKATMIRTSTHKYVRHQEDIDELYDLTDDPQETRNRIQDPAYASVLAQLQDRMLTWYQETADVVPGTVNAREDTPGHLLRARAFNDAHGAA